MYVILLCGLVSVSVCAVVNLELEATPDLIVSSHFLSIALDANLIQHRWANFNTSSAKLRTLARGLSPAYLRLGGTAADFLIFNPSPHGLSKTHKNFTLTPRDWIKLNKFIQHVSWDLIFGLNVLLRKRGDVWDPSNAIQLLDFSAKHNFSLDWELGNEPNAFHHALNRTVDSRQLARDFKLLRNILNGYDLYRNSKLLGPDVTRPKVGHPNSSAMKYLKGFLSSGGMQSVQAVTFHQYYFSAVNATPQDFLNTTIMNTLKQQIRDVVNIVDAYGGGVVVLGETDGASGGGAAGLDNSYISGFLWLDKLGTAAAEGVQVVIRQSLYYGRYALLDNHLHPLPDYWLSYLHKTLVGRKVVRVRSSNKDVRLYAHCLKNSSGVKGGSSGGLVVFGMNLKAAPALVNLPTMLSSCELYEYILHPCNGLLTDTCVMLNDKPLHLVHESLPKLHPVHKAASETLKLQPQRLAFYVFPQANYKYCN